MCDKYYLINKPSIYPKSSSLKCIDFYQCVKVLCVVAVLCIITATTYILTWNLYDVDNTEGGSNTLQQSLHTNINFIFIKRIPELSIMKSFKVIQNLTDNKEQRKIVSCYYNTPTRYEINELLPANVHPHLCTHINVAFAKVINKKIFLEEIQYRALSDIVKLKNNNPTLKILLSVGGAGNEGGFSDMVANHASRKVFIKSLKSILRNYTLDGIDLDWEFPAIHLETNLNANRRERQHFSQLLREIRSEYIREKRNYLLTVAVAAPETIVSVSYDVDQLNLYTDFVNIMTYDFHSYTKYTPLTGLNSPLYPRHDELLYMATLNINYTVQMYLNKGLSSNKIVVGIPTYGHSFTLVNPENTKVGSPCSGVGSLGGNGFVNYPDICLYISNYSDVVIKLDEEASVPYLSRDREWVSYESPASVAAKADYIRRHGLGGAMVYSLNADDFRGVCRRAARPTGRPAGRTAGRTVPGGPLNFPLLRSVKNTLFGMAPTDSLK